MDTEIQDRIRKLQEKIITLNQLMTTGETGVAICDIIAKEIHQSLTKDQLAYLERIVEELISEKGSIEVLIYLNFNSRKYFAGLTRSIKTQLGSRETKAEKLEMLRHELKLVNQVPCEFGMVYSIKYPSLKQMVSDWISEEIQFLEQTGMLTTPSNVDEAIKKDFKLEFDMSVSQFAFFIKSFIETGVILNKNISELIRFLSRFVKTKRSENISSESFRMKYYNVESGTKDSLKNLLRNAIGYINNN